MTALDKLIEAVEAGEISKGVTGLKAFEQFSRNAFGLYQSNAAWRAYGGSIDAALALHEALLPGWVFRITGGGPMPIIGDYRIPHVHVFRPKMTEDDEPIGASSSGFDCGDPARAWLLAILRAYRSVQA